MADKPTGDEMFEFTSAMQLATAAIRDAIEGTNSNTEEVEKNTETAREARKAAQEKKAAEDKATKATNEHSESVKKSKAALAKFGKELYDIGNAGIKLGSALGTSATKGVELEFKNRTASALQLLQFNTSLADLGAMTEQVATAQKGLAASFVSVREGMQFSARGSVEFVRDLKKGFKSEFEPTAETFRTLTEMGMSTTSQFDAFRRATGRASLSSTQLTTLYNKNRLSFLLYGNSFAKAAVNAERLGINLASIQSAQESLVTNLDGTIDTVAQINQLGGSIDFSELVRISEQEGPDALMAYVRATVPEYMMQSASTRSLFKQLGISVEDYMKSGDKQQSAANQLEQQMTEAASETGKFTSALATAYTYLTRGYGILTTTFLPLAVSAIQAIVALKVLGTTGGGAAGMMGKLVSGFASVAFYLGLFAIALAGVWAMFSGRKMVKEGNVGQGTALGTVGGAVTGAAIGTMIAPGVGTAIGAGIGGVLGGIAAYSGKQSIRTGGDVVSRPGSPTSIGREGTLKKNARQSNMMGMVGGAGGTTTELAETSALLWNNRNMRQRLLGMLSKNKKILGAGSLVGGAFDFMQTYGAGKDKGRTNQDALTRGTASALMTSGASYLGGIGLPALAAMALGTAATGGILPILLAAGGAIGGGILGKSVFDRTIGDDVYSGPAGYGERVLLTPQGPIALNNKDTVMAFADDMLSGTKTFPLGYLAGAMNAGGGQQNTALIRKVTELMDAIGNAKTSITVDNKTYQVPRMAMAGVYTRNERT